MLEINDVKIAKYAFSGRDGLDGIRLGEAVREIGAHAFYNCRNLSHVEMCDRITSMGDGAFKNCGRLRSITVKCRGGNFRGLKDLLSELNQQLSVMIEYAPGDCAVLIFPYYFQDYEENTPARIINQVTVGSGIFYRESVGRDEVSYALYDRNFYSEKAIENLDAVYQTALFRLAFPHRLGEGARRDYEDYLKANFNDIFQLLVEKDRQEHANLLLSLSLWTQEQIRGAVQDARKRQQMDILSLLLAYEKEHYETKRKFYQF